LEESSAGLTERETKLLKLHLEGWTNGEIASAWGANLGRIRVDVNALMAKIRYRVQHQKRKPGCF